MPVVERDFQLNEIRTLSARWLLIPQAVVKPGIINQFLCCASVLWLPCEHAFEKLDEHSLFFATDLAERSFEIYCRNI
jgi:hypothetical protein